MVAVLVDLSSTEITRSESSEIGRYRPAGADAPVSRTDLRAAAKQEAKLRKARQHKQQENDAATYAALTEEKKAKSKPKKGEDDEPADEDVDKDAESDDASDEDMVEDDE